MDKVREVGRNGGWCGFATVIGTQYGDPLLPGFVGLQGAEDIL